MTVRISEADARRLGRGSRRSRRRRGPRVRGKGKSDLEALLAHQLQVAGLPGPETTRRWRFDNAWPALRIAAEVEGGTWSRTVKCRRCGTTVTTQSAAGKEVAVRLGGRHRTGKGFEADCEKYNAAARLGWRVFRFPESQIRNEEALALLREVLAEEKPA